ncbi:MAG: hypothetical protein R3F31_20690 [Verrucomicrobiales bacterium]
MLGDRPEDEVVAGEVGFAYLGVLLDRGEAAELLPPMLPGMGLLAFRPGPDGGIERGAGRLDHEEGVHEGVIDRS